MHLLSTYFSSAMKVHSTENKSSEYVGKIKKLIKNFQMVLNVEEKF